MRLLHSKSLDVKEFFESAIPPYAILSHTWGEDEISFQDMQGDRAALSAKAGYMKITKSCEVAANDGFDFVWVDTCCIDKTSSSELSEAINSMYRWYANADVCYVYLSDVYSIPSEYDAELLKSILRQSRWFTRGWTLQELIAPTSLIFFTGNWTEIGTKDSFGYILSIITGIQSEALQGGSLDDFSIAQKMSWASGRETTRDEDRAYSLMGIFNVHMPMLYGEGQSAFLRLQEEIMRRSDDHTIFAWTLPWLQSFGKPVGLLAPSPIAFAKSGRVVSIKDESGKPFTLTNQGISIYIPSQPFLSRERVIFDCEDLSRPGYRLGIEVESNKDISGSYCRVHSHLLPISTERFQSGGERVPIVLSAYNSEWKSATIYSVDSVMFETQQLTSNGIRVLETFPQFKHANGMLRKRDLEKSGLGAIKFGIGRKKSFVLLVQLESDRFGFNFCTCNPKGKLADQVHSLGAKSNGSWRFILGRWTWISPNESWGINVTIKRRLVNGRRCIHVGLEKFS